VIVAMKSRIGNDGSISKQAVVGSYDGKEAKLLLLIVAIVCDMGFWITQN
jgi:hypothetical protein